MEKDIKLKNFKKIIMKAMGLSNIEQIEMFNKIPDAIIAEIFKNNFNNNYQLARKIIFNKFDKDDYKKIESEKLKINDISKAANLLSSNIKNGTKILFLTDTDNDGSLAQANILEFNKSLKEEKRSNVEMLFCQQINGNTARGFTVDLVDAWVEKNPEYKTQEFTIVSADNGINSLEEQIKINAKYPNAKLIVTDHHLPDEENVVVENDKTLIVNPKYKPVKYFTTKNISGANVLGKLLELTLENLDVEELNNKDTVIKHMKEISRIANLLDYVDTDITDKPLEDYLISKYASIGTAMNVNNSLNKIIVSDYSNEEIKDLFSDVEDLNIDPIIEAISKIKTQNILAKKILTLQMRYIAMPDVEKGLIPKDRIHADLIIELNNQTAYGNDINPNYIEQLRPYIYNYAASSELNDYELGLMNSMEEIYAELKKQERILQKEFGRVQLLNMEKEDNSTILFPKNSNHLKLLNRKLLGKIFNEENNGMLTILDSSTKDIASGSFRSHYRIQEILENKSGIEDLLGIKLTFQGHDKAAGFFIKKEDGSELTPAVISAVNKFLSQSIGGLKLTNKTSYKHLIQTDFHYPAIDLFNKFNKAVKGSLTNMQSIEPVVQFTKSTYLTNGSTQKDENLQQLLKDKKYGYVPVNITFHGETVILPTEMLRKLKDSNFKDGIQISFMNDGAFIGQNVIPDVSKQKLTKIRSPKTERDKIIEFYKETYENNNYFVELPQEKIEQSPFFKYNKFGEKEYSRFEKVVLDVIERSGTEMIVVADTEANGLGNAPKVCNFGVVEMMIDKNSGSKIKKETFDNSYFTDIQGGDYLLSKAQISKMEVVTKDVFDSLNINEKTNYLTNKKTGVIYKNDGDFSLFKKLNNSKVIGNEVIVNRKLKFNIGSLFIKDNDAKMSEKIISLTSIDNTLLNKIGMSSEKADQILKERYAGKKCIFQAHNLPYDLGVIKGNFKDFYNVVTDFSNGNLLNDSAIYSRENKLAYDPIGIAVFEKDFVPALADIQFFNSRQSSLSLPNFLSTDEDGKLPDRTGRFILKKKNQKVYLIDRKENSTTKVVPLRDENASNDETDIQILSELIKEAEMPSNAIKYSVQALSDYDIIRAMILSVDSFKLKTIEIPTNFVKFKDTMDYFMLNYHFDTSLYDNFDKFSKTLDEKTKEKMFVTEGWAEERIQELREAFIEEQAMLPPRQRKRKEPDFRAYIGTDPKLVEFEQFAEKFLEENKHLQEKFHEIWAYKKVLQMVNPTKETLKDNDIIDLITYETSINKEKVMTILKDAVNYKDIYNIDSVIQKEPHNNVFMDKCDVVLESVLTFKRPSDRSYNSYTHSMDDVVDMYLKNVVKTTGQHIISQQRKMALDSFSRKQALSYSRKTKTDYIAENQEITPEVKFKFSADTLPQDTFAYGVLRKELTEEQVDEFSEKAEFVVRNMQMLYSLDEKLYEDQNLLEGMHRILKCNEEQVTALKDELAENFETLEYSRKEDHMKKILKIVIGAYAFGEALTVPKTMSVLTNAEKDKLVELTKSISDIAVNLGVNKLPVFNDSEMKISKSTVLDNINNEKEVEVVSNPLVSFFDDIQTENEKDRSHLEIELEKARDPSERDALLRKNIVPVVKIKRQNDSKHLFKFHELLNNFMDKISTKEGRDQVFNLDLEEELTLNKNKLVEKQKKEAEKAEKAAKRKLKL